MKERRSTLSDIQISRLLGGICGCFDDSSGPRVTEARGVLLFLTSN
jgi:hypothetical protein